MKRNKILNIIVVALVVCSIFAGCKNTKDAVVVVGGEPVSKASFDFYLKEYKNQMSSTMPNLQSDPNAWNTVEIQGKKAIDLAKEKTLDQVVEDKVVYLQAKKEGIKLSSEDKKTIAEKKAQTIKQFGGQDAYDKFLKENNIDDKFVENLFSQMQYREKLIGKYIKDEDVKKIFEAEYMVAKHVLIPTTDSSTGKALSDAEVATATKQANDVLAQAKAGSDFDALMKTYSKDPGLAQNPDGYVFTKGEMVPEFEKAVTSIKAGEITMVKSSYGYHVIKRLDLNEKPSFFDGVKSKIKEAQFTKLDKIKDWKTAFKIEKNDAVYNAIK